MLEEIDKLKYIVFQGEPYNLTTFNKYFDQKDYNRVRVMTESMVEIHKDSMDAARLDDLITELCVKQEDANEVSRGN